jgi:hypothetical protein
MTKGRRWAGYALRAALFAAFVWYLWSQHYAPHRFEPFADADTEAAVRAINAGRPFHLLYENGERTPPTIKRMSEVYGDLGLQMAIGFVAQAERRLHGPSIRFDTAIGRTMLLALFVVTAAAMVADGVPLLVALAGVMAMWTLFKWGPMVLGPAQHWGVAYVAVVTAIYVGAVFNPWTASRVVSLALLAVLAALSQLLRQEGSTVPTAVGIAMVATAGLIVVALRWVDDAGTRSARQVAKRAALGGMLLLAVNSAVPPIERWVLSNASGTSFADTPAAAHGAGAPLYLSLGYVSNPFNIAWRDPVGVVHARLIVPGMGFWDPEYQPTLFREFVDIVISRPWLLLENVAAKAQRVHALAMGRADRLPDVAVWQRPPHTRFYKALPWVGALCLAILWLRGTPETAAIVLTSAALAAAASAGALVVFPDYMGGVQGATMVLAIIMPASVAASLIESSMAPTWVSARLTRRVLAEAGALGVAALVIGGGFVGVQWMRYRALQEEVVARDPVDAIEAMQFRYAHVFNDLPVARQGRLLARLLAGASPAVARLVERHGDVDLFRPEALVRTSSQLHLIAWMGTAFQPPVPPLYQGTTHALVFLCGECPPSSGMNDFPLVSGWEMVNDLEWRGRYRMFSVALNSRLKASRAFHVTAEKVTSLDPSNQTTGLRSQAIATAEFTF